MKGRIDLRSAGEAEAYGALASGHRRQLQRWAANGSRLAPAQLRALADLARSFLELARQAGADGKAVKLGGISFELHEIGTEEVLSIRKAAAA